MPSYTDQQLKQANSQVKINLDSLNAKLKDLGIVATLEGTHELRTRREGASTFVGAVPGSADEHYKDWIKVEFVGKLTTRKATKWDIKDKEYQEFLDEKYPVIKTTKLLMKMGCAFDEEEGFWYYEAHPVDVAVFLANANELMSK